MKAGPFWRSTRPFGPEAGKADSLAPRVSPHAWTVRDADGHRRSEVASPSRSPREFIDAAAVDVDHEAPIVAGAVDPVLGHAGDHGSGDPVQARSAAPGSTRRGSGATLAAGLLFVAVFLFFWISVNPFVDLRDPTSQTPSETAGLLNQAVGVVLAALSAVGLASGSWRSCRVLAVPLFVAPLAWISVTVVGSVDVGLSARRFVLTLLIIVQVVNVVLIPRDRSQFALFLGLSLLGVLAVCYGGVLFKPELATHSVEDILEPMHAGDWRGSFIHKNAAGGAMALAVIASIFVGRGGSAVLGVLLALASANFLLQTSSKTSLALLPVALLLAEMLLRLRSAWLRSAVLLTVLGLFGLFTVGSVLLPPVHAIVAAVSSDPTYTNRDQIWTFALSEFRARPILGHGFEAFWRSQSVFYGAAESFANTAANAHDGYLDILVTTGAPGLLLCLLAFVIQPLKDLHRSLEAGRDASTIAFFTRIWVFCLLQSFLESIFFNNTPGWFMFLVAIVGLRFSARAPIIRSARPDPATVVDIGPSHEAAGPDEDRAAAMTGRESRRRSSHSEPVAAVAPASSGY